VVFGRSGVMRARLGRSSARFAGTGWSPTAVRRTPALTAVVVISSAGSVSKMSHNAANTASDSRSGMRSARTAESCSRPVSQAPTTDTAQTASRTRVVERAQPSTEDGLINANFVRAR
jgi:hypothetical protein